MFRRFFVWTMLFILPLQSFVATSMVVHCAPSNHEQKSVAFERRHTETNTIAMGIGYDHEPSIAIPSVDSHDHPGGSDVSHQEITCCASVLAMTTLAVITPFPPAQYAAIFTYDIVASSTLFLEGPRRPPRFLFA
jgi:hypothetical protein